MGRMTRAKAAEVAEKLHIDGDVILDLPADDLARIAGCPAVDERPPLGELSINRAGGKAEQEGLEDAEKPAGSIPCGKKGLKGQKAKESPPDVEQDEAVVPEEIESQPWPASRTASEDLIKHVPQLNFHVPQHGIRPGSPPSEAIRLTRSRLRSLPPDLDPVKPNSLVEAKAQTEQVEEVRHEGAQQYTAPPGQPEPGSEAAEPQSVVNTSTLNDPFLMPNCAQIPNGRTPIGSPAQWRQADTKLVGNDDRTPTRTSEQAVVDTSTPCQSQRVKIPDIPVADPTYDDLKTATLIATTPPRPGTKSASPSGTQDAILAMDTLGDEVDKVHAELPEMHTLPEKPKLGRKATPVVRTTKASQARISLAHGPKDAAKAPALGRPRQSSARQSSAQFQPSQSTARRMASTSSAKSTHGNADGDVAREKKEVNIPHSKPRPMSLQFPTPPPPPKSTKAPTKSTFQLPGEAIAAKLKAAKEARLQKGAEASATKTFKARPAPSFASKPAPAVRQTSTSRARESITNGKTVASARRPHRVVAAATRPTSTTKPARPTSALPPPAATALHLPKRPRSATAVATQPQPPRTLKGKQVFHRAAQAQSHADKAKRDKEEAAQNARAQAAQRSRQLSRDWAEKKLLLQQQQQQQQRVKNTVVAV